MASGVDVCIADVEKILNDPTLKDKNRFLPTKRQCNALIDLNQLQANGRVMPRSATQWQSVAKGLEDALFFQLENGGIERKEDMFQRAELIVSHLEKNVAINKFFYMDGHGRFTFALIDTLLRSPKMIGRLDGLNLVVVDINEDAHLWHTEFFPTDMVQCVCEDIYKQNPTVTDFFYFNYCGIGGRKGQLALINFINANVVIFARFLVSMSTKGNELDKKLHSRKISKPASKRV